MDHRPDPFELEALVIAGDFTPEVRAWLQLAHKARSDSNGEIPLERVLGLPRAQRRRQISRDVYIRRAYALLSDAQAGRARAEALAEEITAFFRVVKSVAPDGTLGGRQLSAVRGALLAAYRQNAGLPASWRHLLRICDTDSSNLSREEEEPSPAGIGPGLNKEP